jgi:quinoprotein glucose dehydrogenase
MVGNVTMSKEALADISQTIFDKGSVREQQQMLRVLGTLPVAKTEGIFTDLIGKLVDKKLPPTVWPLIWVKLLTLPNQLH